MRILACSDLHGRTDLHHLAVLAQTAELILCGGDLAGWSRDADEVLLALDTLGEHTGKHVVLTHGNHDHNVQHRSAQYARIRYLHRDIHLVEDVAVLAYGGGGFRLEDPDVEAFLTRAMQLPEVRERKTVWLFHGPPHDMTVDVIPGYGPTGCKTKRAMIHAFQPDVVVAGHIHEAHGLEHRAGKTRIINPGVHGVLFTV